VVSVFEDDDLYFLGIFPGHFGWGPPTIVDTANGAVERNTCYIEVVWLGDDRRPLENQYHLERAIVMSGRSTNDGATRPSGMSLRKMFTATAPDGNGILYFA